MPTRIFEYSHNAVIAIGASVPAFGTTLLLFVTKQEMPLWFGVLTAVVMPTIFFGVGKYIDVKYKYRRDKKDDDE